MPGLASNFRKLFDWLNYHYDYELRVILYQTKKNWLLKACQARNINKSQQSFQEIVQRRGKKNQHW